MIRPLRLLAAGLFTVLAVGEAAAQSAAAGLYAEGNDLYRRGEFAGARQRYLAASGTGLRDERLFYNLGNACFKDGRLGEAIVWYERARRVAPRDEDVLANLRFLRRIKRDREEEEDGAFLYELYLWPTSNELFAGLSLSLLGLAAAASWRLLRGSGPAAVVALGLCLGGILGFGAFAGTRLHRELTLSEAVVTAIQGQARGGPDLGQTPVFVVHEGTKVTVERREGEWLLVRLDNGLGGWLPADLVTMI